MRAELARIMDGAYLGSDKTPETDLGASRVRLLCGQAFWVAERSGQASHAERRVSGEHEMTPTEPGGANKHCSASLGQKCGIAFRGDRDVRVIQKVRLREGQEYAGMRCDKSSDASVVGGRLTKGGR